MIIVLQIAVYVLLHNTNYYIYAPLAIATTLILAAVFKSVKGFIVQRLCASLGRVSLESYLCNVVLIDIISLIPVFRSAESINRGNYLYYGVIIVLTIAGAYLVSWTSKHVIKHLVRS